MFLTKFGKSWSNAFWHYLILLFSGVTFTENPGDNSDEIQLIPDPVFTLPTDGSTVTIINSTEDGRIFYGTKEGNLFEITYQVNNFLYTDIKNLFLIFSGWKWLVW